MEIYRRGEKEKGPYCTNSYLDCNIHSAGWSGKCLGRRASIESVCIEHDVRIVLAGSFVRQGLDGSTPHVLVS